MDACALSQANAAVSPDVFARAQFVAVNTIHCQADYVERFECLFCSRARAIDSMTGFLAMQVLKPSKPEEAYLVVSYWESEDQFNAWVGSPEFYEGHKRAFEDLKRAKEEGKEPPMKSDFQTYAILTR